MTYVSFINSSMKENR